jgi:hypothetical protein
MAKQKEIVNLLGTWWVVKRIKGDRFVDRPATAAEVKAKL